MKTLILIGVLLVSACASTPPPRTKWSDPVMRLMIDPDSIDAKNYARIQSALVSSGKWTVIDRNSGFKALILEQERQHRLQNDRFDNKEKYAIWGKLYGVGGIVIAHNQCSPQFRWLKGNFMSCVQGLAILSANTGEILASIENEAEADYIIYGEMEQVPAWDNAVEKLNNAFPKRFEKQQYTPEMLNFRAEAQEEAVRQQEQQKAK